MTVGLVATLLSAAGATACAKTEAARTSAEPPRTTAATSASPYTLTDTPELRAIDCPTTTMCAAVGKNYLAVLAKGQWTVEHTPQLPNLPDVWLDAVSCPTKIRCLAVGGINVERQQNSRPVLEMWDGRSWTLSTPSFFGAEGGLTGVSCSSATVCFVIGATGATAKDVSPVVAQLTGTRWHRIALPAASPLNQSQLDSIRCTSSTMCAVVATTESAVGAFASIWSGKTWITQAFPQLVTNNWIQLRCPAANDCTAVPDGARDSVTTLIWNGSRWSSHTYRIKGPVPQDQSSLYLAGCWQETGCLAISAGSVGTALGSAHQFAPLIVHLNGVNASSRIMPVATSYASGQIFGADCPSTGLCYAIGEARSSVSGRFWVGRVL